MNCIKKLFIPDYQNIEDAKVRLRYGVVAGIFGIFSNLFLFALKIIIGLVGNSITILAEAINNLSDAGSSVVTVFGFKMSARPADKEHPYGHARYEYITGFFVAFIVLAIGVMLGKSSVEKILHPETVTITIFTYLVLIVAILMKLWQMAIYVNFGKTISSEALRASGIDSRNDIISTVSVLIATIVMDVTELNIDGYMGLAVSIFIVISAIKLIKDTIDPLLGTLPDAALVEKIRSKILSYEGVLGIHDLMIHCYGASQCFAIVHVEVSASANAMASHDLMDNIERDFHEHLGINLSIHMDPVEVDNPQVLALRGKAAAVLHQIDERLTLHDFRVVQGTTHTNVLFDVVVPFEVRVEKEDILTALDASFNTEEKMYYFIIQLDRGYV